MPGVGIGVKATLNVKIGSASPYNAITRAWIAEIISRGGSVETIEKRATSSFIDGLESDAYRFDRLNDFGLQNKIAAKTSIVNPTSTAITEVSSPTFTPGQGFNGNGLSSYLICNYNPVTDGLNFVSGNFAYGVYYRTPNASSTIIISNNLGGYYIQTLTNGYNIECGGPTLSYTGTTSLGLLSAVVNGGVSRIYERGVNIKSNNQSSALVNQGFYLLSYGGILNSTSQLSISYMSSGSVNQSNFYTQVQALGTSLGWAV
jgi:hypothetical protein